MSTELKLDLHRLLSGQPAQTLSNTAALVALCIPGVFIECVMLLANPSLVRSLIANVKGIADYGNSFFLVLALILAYLIGSILIIYITIFRQVIWYARLIVAQMWRLFCKLASQKWIPALAAKLSSIRSRSLMSQLSRFFFNQSEYFDMRKPVRALNIATSRLLELKYGIGFEDRCYDLGDWINILALPPVRARFPRWITLFTVTGWGMFFATRLELLPHLPLIFQLALFLIVVGLWLDLCHMENFINPRKYVGLQVLGILDQIAEENTLRQQEKKQEGKSE
jgi:hypothetical protein